MTTVVTTDHQRKADQWEHHGKHKRHKLTRSEAKRLSSGKYWVMGRESDEGLTGGTRRAARSKAG